MTVAFVEPVRLSAPFLGKQVRLGSQVPSDGAHLGATEQYGQ